MAAAALQSYVGSQAARRKPITTAVWLRNSLGSGSALADDGDHFRLAFDRPGTWSQKYNLVWDKILKLGLFPEECEAKEVRFYKQQLLPYGLPLDNPCTVYQDGLAGLDGDPRRQPGGFRSSDETRVSICERNAGPCPSDRLVLGALTRRLRGFRARPVIGGVFIPFLAAPEIWEKWQRQTGFGASLP